MISDRQVLRPGTFGRSVPCDMRRQVFDARNEQIIRSDREVACVFLGDSITEMWDVQLCFGGCGLIVNRGVGGDVTEYIFKRAEADAFQLFPKRLVKALIKF